MFKIQKVLMFQESYTILMNSFALKASTIGLKNVSL